MRRKKLAATVFLAACTLVVGLATEAAVWIVHRAASGRVYDDLVTVPANDVGLVLGTSPHTAGGGSNPHFDNRMAAAALLYHAGRVQHLLLSGDNGTRGYDEPADMKTALLALGVPADAMTVDDAGFRTLDSVVRARVVFGQTRLTVVTDRFHAYRAVFLARQSGVDAIAFPSREVAMRASLKSRVRECGADLKACLDLWVLHTRPKFLGEPIPVRDRKPLIPTGAMLNYIWLALIVLSVVLGEYNGQLAAVTLGAFEGAKTAVMGIALPLVGTLAIWLGIMRLAERSGLVQVLAQGLRPLMRWLFPDVPQDHPALGAIVMNVAANMLGLGNAATPLGLRAMNDLERLNPHPGTATNAMCTFLAINTSSVQLIPATAIAILVANGARDPTAIVGTALFATSCACVAGITAAKLLERLPVFSVPAVAIAEPGKERASTHSEVAPVVLPPPMTASGPYILALFGLFAATAFGWEAFHRPASIGLEGVTGPFLRMIGAVSLLAVPCMLAFFPLYAAVRRIKVYEEFIEGAKEGFPVALRIIPFLVAMLVAIGMFRGSGGMDLLTRSLRPALDWIHFPADLLPMVVMRPLSGSGTQGLFTDIVKSFGPDSLLTRTAATIYGSTETTFYVIAVYFGSVAIRRTRHAIAAGLIADLTGVVVSVAICRLMPGWR